MGYKSFKVALKATKDRIKKRFRRRSKQKTWFNAGLTPDVVFEKENAEGSSKRLNPGVSLALKRIRNGKCPFCGIPTHTRTIFGGLKTNTIGGDVMNGHCLRCFPISDFTERRPNTPNSENAVDGQISKGGETKSDMLLFCDSDRVSHVSELSGSFYCNINELS
jgi:hypothetical protein